MAHNICKLFNFMQYEQCNQHLLKSIGCAKWATYLGFCLYFHHGPTSKLTMGTMLLYLLVLTSVGILCLENPMWSLQKYLCSQTG